ncbi:hypothetical protein [Jeotgalibacillus sp. S-D1]|uniref:hypothetical protein n=1 Tax=Jeotgalibacillus sp. S-D1 TaxID=2552189 RepID=UPI0014053B60|nr:hypothetical protein [Jeotgalibacillus sp. S-D1]
MNGKKLVAIMTILVVIMIIIIFILVRNFQPSGMDPEQGAAAENDQSYIQINSY